MTQLIIAPLFKNDDDIFLFNISPRQYAIMIKLDKNAEKIAQ